MLARARALADWRAFSVIIALVVVLVACAQLVHPAAQASGSPQPTVVAVASASPTATPTLAPTPTPLPTPNPFLSRRVTLLVLGSDSTPARLRSGSGRLTDSITVLSVNKAHNQVSMISFPRDIVDIPMGTGEVWRSKINGISYYRGEAAMKKAISATIRQPIDYYAEVNMIDFAKMIDAIGGVDIVVPRTIIDPSISLRIIAGKRHMNGNLALKYARSRHTTSDWDRAARQQQLIVAVVRKMVDPNTKLNFLDLLASLQSLRTDLPLSKFPALFELARKSARAKVVTQVLAPPRYSLFAGLERGTGRGYIQEPNLAAIRAYAASVMGR
jgi:LCP family protein required for cell wall assembly